MTDGADPGESPGAAAPRRRLERHLVALKQALRALRTQAGRLRRAAGPGIAQAWAFAVEIMPPAQSAAPQMDGAQGTEALRRVHRSLRRPIAAAAVFSLVLNALALTLPVYMSQVYDRVLTSYSAETLIMLTVMALGLLMLFVVIGLVAKLRKATRSRKGRLASTRPAS